MKVSSRLVSIQPLPNSLYIGYREARCVMGVWTEAKITFLAYSLRTRYPHLRLGVTDAVFVQTSPEEKPLFHNLPAPTDIEVRDVVQVTCERTGQKVMRVIGQCAKYRSTWPYESTGHVTRASGVAVPAAACKSVKKP